MPIDAAAKFQEAQSLASRGRLLDARRLCLDVLAHSPDDAPCALLLFNIASRLGDMDRALGAIMPVEARFADNPDVRSAIANAANTGWACDAERVFELHAQYGRALERARPDGSVAVGELSSPTHPPRSEPDPAHSLRIGIVTYDYKSRSSVSFFLIPILRHIPPGVEVTAYHTGPEDDKGTARFRAMVQRFRHVPRISNDDLAAQIRSDKIDISLDLIGHTGARRLPAFQPRCAPVQVSYLGYSNTTGVRSIDWRIVDGITDPPGSERLSTERLVRLDPCFVCFEPDPETPPVAPAPSTHRDYTTFGSFSNLSKLTDGTLRRWSRLLAAVPGSRLLLKNRAGPEERTLLRERLSAAAIDLGRVELRAMTRTYPEHLAAYADVDIALDTWPYNGTTTVCDSLLMGVPIVAMHPDPAHDRHAARVTLSLVSAAGCPELIAADEDKWAARNVALAADSGQLESMRREIRARLLASPLCDAPAFAQRFWATVDEMWRERATGNRPRTAM